MQTQNDAKKGRLILENGQEFSGHAFGFPHAKSGEVVFNTGMVGYPESLSDPSYKGQILTLTFPMIGNYGVPPLEQHHGIEKARESGSIHIAGLIVSQYSREFSHWQAERSLADWLNEFKVPALTGIDTRALTKVLREHGSMLGKIVHDDDPDIALYNPNADDLVRSVCISEPQVFGSGSKRIAVIDCGCKNHILHHLLDCDLEVLCLPYDADLSEHTFDALLVSNGPGNPDTYQKTVGEIKKVMAADKPIFGICLGHQLIAQAAGARTYKLKYGHRGQNQPVQEVGGQTCFITSQNHGFAVDNDSLPQGWQPWFINLNDQSNEGIRHQSGRWMSVQFHPEAAPGPFDASVLFQKFRRIIAEHA